MERRPRARGGRGSLAGPAPRAVHRRAVGDDEEADELSDEIFEFRVTGHEPRPWGTGKSEWVWSAAVASAIREEGAAAPDRSFQINGCQSRSCSV